MSETNEVVTPVSEPTVTFKSISDRMIMDVVNADNKEVLIQISGYDLRIDFNMQYLRSIQDVEAAVGGIAQLFRDAIMEAALGHIDQKQ